MAAEGLFITGTDTGVGKTIVSATLARLLSRRGCNVGVMKPVTSGCIERDGRPISEDCELLLWAAGIEGDENAAPYLLSAPLAPSVAAEQEGVRIDFVHIADCYRRLAERHDFVIVEGAGGLMVPISGGLLMADLARHLDLPLLVVTRPNLGTINHTFLTTYAAGQLGLTTKGIIINNFPAEPGPAESYAPHLLDSLCGPLLGVYPHIAGNDPREVIETLAAKLEKEPATTAVLRILGAIG